MEEIIVKEYKKSNTFQISKDKDLSYLEKEVFHPGAKTFDVVRSNRSDDFFIQNSSYAGIIQLSDKRVQFSTKVKTNLFYLLSFLKSEKDFLYDPDFPIKIKEGVNFFDILGKLFLNELEEILKKGIIKKYISKSENLKFLRGRINMPEQMKHSISGNPKFSCIYDDLTFDNLENRIILKALNTLINLIRFNEKLRNELLDKEYFLRDWISFIDVSPDDCDQVEYNRINEGYETIINLSKLILSERYIRSTERGESVGFNFIVNMNKVFEDFITELIKEILNEDNQFANYRAMGQYSLNTLDEEGRLTIRPDLVIIEKNSGKHKLILDTKYKTNDSNNDYYQLIAYSLAMPDAEECCLVYPSDFIKEDILLVNRDLLKPSKKITVDVKGINLYIDENLGYKEYVLKMKQQIKDKILRPKLLV